MGAVDWADRIALNKLIKPARIWIHASSVGEVKVAETLIRRLRQQDPNLPVHLSVMTAAGYEMAAAIVSSLPEPVGLSYAPADTKRWVRRFLNRLRPKVLIITETEIWPNLIIEAARNGVQLFLVNGRMTTRSFERYMKVSGMILPVVSRYGRCFFKTGEDLERFVTLGLPSDRAEIAGDMKFDTSLTPVSKETIAAERERLGIAPDQFMLVAGSTRSGVDNETDEEEQLLSLYAALKPKFPQLRLVLAPRHLERVDTVARKVQAATLPVAVIDSERTSVGGTDDPVLVVGYIGGLIQLYRAASLAFVGGTLVSKGGHNLLEPVWAGTPVIFGPSLDNVSEASDYIITNRFGARVTDIKEMIELACRLIAGEITFEQRRSDDASQSATDRVMAYLKKAGLV
jgi:3-deoxy-D-manno-octulosonic-acid transferase